MKGRILFLLLLFLLVPVFRSIAQKTPDPKQALLAVSAHLKTMTHPEFKELAAKAQTGDAEAQFWTGGVYEEGKLVPKDSGEAMQWFLKSAEQGYVPAQRI
jgi:TPR repeat protein